MRSLGFLFPILFAFFSRCAWPQTSKHCWPCFYAGLDSTWLESTRLGWALWHPASSEALDGPETDCLIIQFESYSLCDHVLPKQSNCKQSTPPQRSTLGVRVVNQPGQKSLNQNWNSDTLFICWAWALFLPFILFVWMFFYVASNEVFTSYRRTAFFFFTTPGHAKTSSVTSN